MRDSLGKDIEPYVLDQNMLHIMGDKEKDNIIIQRNTNTTIILKTIKGSIQIAQIDQFKNFCNALLDDGRSYIWVVFL